MQPMSPVNFVGGSNERHECYMEWHVYLISGASMLSVRLLALSCTRVTVPSTLASMPTGAYLTGVKVNNDAAIYPPPTVRRVRDPTA